MNGPKQQTTKIMKQTSETTWNMGGTVMPIGTGRPCHFAATQPSYYVPLFFGFPLIVSTFGL